MATHLNIIYLIWIIHRTFRNKQAEKYFVIFKKMGKKQTNKIRSELYIVQRVLVKAQGHYFKFLSQFQGHYFIVYYKLTFNYLQFKKKC